MLNLRTLEKVSNWLTVRRAELNASELKELQCTESKKILLDNLITEINNKTADIRARINSGGSLGNLILVKSKKGRDEYECPDCGAHRTITKTYFSGSYLKIAEKLFKYCVENNTNIIQTHDIKELNHTDYCNLAKLQRFGLIYFVESEKKRSGKWGVAVDRIYSFLK